MKNKQRIFSFLQLIIAVALLTGFDQWTKFLAVENLKGKADIPLIPNIFNIWKTEELPLVFFKTRKSF